MATIDDAAAMAMDLAEVTEGTSYRNRAWAVAAKTFCWERPFSKADLKRFGDAPPPKAPILAVRVEDLAENAAVLAAETTGVFDIAHFGGYPAVLIELPAVSMKDLCDAIVDAWLATAPTRLVEAHLNATR
ncbi:MAG: hypothetical protein ACR2MB_03185 [Acidimicrobiales bacterium]